MTSTTYVYNILLLLFIIFAKSNNIELVQAHTNSITHSLSQSQTADSDAHLKLNSSTSIIINQTPATIDGQREKAKFIGLHSLNGSVTALLAELGASSSLSSSSPSSPSFLMHTGKARGEGDESQITRGAYTRGNNDNKDTNNNSAKGSTAHTKNAHNQSNIDGDDIHGKNKVEHDNFMRDDHDAGSLLSTSSSSSSLSASLAAVKEAVLDVLKVRMFGKREEGVKGGVEGGVEVPLVKSMQLKLAVSFVLDNNHALVFALQKESEEHERGHDQEYVDGGGLKTSIAGSSSPVLRLCYERFIENGGTSPFGVEANTNADTAPSPPALPSSQGPSSSMQAEKARRSLNKEEKEKQREREKQSLSVSGGAGASTVSSPPSAHPHPLPCRQQRKELLGLEQPSPSLVHAMLLACTEHTTDRAGDSGRQAVAAVTQGRVNFGRPCIAEHGGRGSGEGEGAGPGVCLRGYIFDYYLKSLSQV